jgi:hypothetical protein
MKNKSKTKIFFLSLIFSGAFLTPITLASNAEEVVSRSPNLTLSSQKRDWKNDEQPNFEVKLERDGFFSHIWDSATGFGDHTKNLKVELIAPDRRIISNLEEGKDYELTSTSLGVKVNLNKTDRLNPGVYDLKLSGEMRGQVVNFNENFSWGVLTLNYNKSVFHPKEKAYLQMGVLDEKGDTLCDAELTINIKKDKEEKNFSTTDNTIQKSDSCGPQTVTDIPDYSAYYDIPDQTGTYQVELTAKTENGQYSISDTIEVKNDIPFEVERESATRIYPVENRYQMKINITANQDFSGNLSEEVPVDFEFSDIVLKKNNEPSGIAYDMVYNQSGTERKNIVWKNVSLKKDETAAITYSYDAPDRSPDIFQLGKFKLATPNSILDKIIGLTLASETIVFEEMRQWQIASDAVASLIMLWDDATTTAPTGWVCISCDSTGPFYQRYIRGSMLIQIPGH